MARKLYITDEMGLDDALADIADVSIKCALMWPWIIPYFDDWGRGEANARRIKGKIFPNFEAISFGDVEGMLNEFAAAGLIQLYEVGGKRYMAVEREKWFRFQTHIHASKRVNEGSRFPTPPGEPPQTEQEPPREIAEPRETTREPAPPRASPSPTLSLSPSPTENPPAQPKKAVRPPQGAMDAPNREKRPDLEQVRAYFTERGHPQIAERFFNTMEGKGWKDRGTPIVKWRATAANWILGEKDRGSPNGRASPSQPPEQFQRQMTGAEYFEWVAKNGATPTGGNQ